MARHGPWLWIAAASAVAGLALFLLLASTPHSGPEDVARDTQSPPRPSMAKSTA